MKIELQTEIDGRWIAELMDRPGVKAYGNNAYEAMDRLFVLAKKVFEEELAAKVRAGSKNVG